MIFALAQDFSTAIAALPDSHPKRHSLQLLGEAIERDAHFIHRHPTTLFQCMWNSCWWYDSPERLKHYVGDDQADEHVVGELAGPQLCVLLRHWRDFKELRTPGFTWLRNSRPPRVTLGSPLRKVIGTDEPVDDFRVSADGTTLTTAGFPTKETWDAIGKVARVSRTGGAKIRRFDTMSGQEIAVPSDVGRFIAFSSDGTRFASWGGDATQVSCVGASTAEFALQQHGTGRIAFSCDGTRIAWDSVEETSCSGSRDWVVTISDGRTGTSMFTLRGSPSAATALSLSCDGRLLASGYATGTIRVWDSTRNAEWKRPPMVLDEGFSNALDAIRAYGAGYAVAAADRTAGEGGELIRIRNDGGSIAALVWCRNAPRLAAGFEGGHVRLWDVGAKAVPVREWKQDSAVSCLAVSPDGEVVASGSRDGEVRVWSVQEDHALMNLRAHDKGVSCLTFHPFEPILISGSTDGTVRFWDWQHAHVSSRRLFDEVNADCLAVSPDKGLLALGMAGEAAVRLVRLSDWVGVGCINLQGDRTRSVAFSSDGLRVLAVAIGLQASDVNLVTMWDLMTGQCVYQHMDFEGEFDNVSHMKHCPIELADEGRESAVRLKGSSDVVGWFPRALRVSTATGQGRLWAGISGDQVFILSLEGDVDGLA